MCSARKNKSNTENIKFYDMRKKFIFAAALCLTTLSLTDNINAAVQITQEVQQDGRTIRGTVIDNTGEPVIGANVTIKGTTNGVITDIDGNFILNNAKGTLVVSFVGYKTQEIPITNKCHTTGRF